MDDPHDEHWRWRAFTGFMNQNPDLSEQHCAALLDLGANDPDFSMEASIMLAVLKRPECPSVLGERAAACVASMGRL